MQTKKQARSAKKLKNLTKQKEKFPEIILKVVETSDIILEILDSRFIEETRNIEIENLIKNMDKKIIYVMNKADLIDKKRAMGLSPYIFISCKKREGIKKLRNRIKIESQKIKKIKKDSYNRIQVGIIGYPNTGKSSVINLLRGKASARTGSESGFTKGVQKIRLTSEILLLDSPGVIPSEKYSHKDKEKISQHAKVGARDYSKVKDPELVIATLIEEFKGLFEKYYKITAKGDSEILLEKLGRRLNFLKKGGKVNIDKTARKILRDWQEGKIRK